MTAADYAVFYLLVGILFYCWLEWNSGHWSWEELVLIALVWPFLLFAVAWTWVMESIEGRP